MENHSIDLPPKGGSYRIVGRALAIAGVLGTGLFAQAPADRSQTEAQSKRAAERLAALQHEAESLATQERSLLAELRKLEVDRAIKVEQLEQIERDVAA